MQSGCKGDVVTTFRPTVCVVNLDAVRANVVALRRNDGAQVCAVVKADGYGHGATACATAALSAGATWLAVALVEEAQVLRDAGITAPILLLSEPPVAALDTVLALHITPFVYTPAFVQALQEAARERGITVDVHVKIDTGMGRVGVAPDLLHAFVQTLNALDRVNVDGVGTHLARADEDAPDAVAETHRQLELFAACVHTLAQAGIRPTFLHAANTAGALRYATARNLSFPDVATTTLLRCGIGIYGLSPSGDVNAGQHGLKPALSLTSAVSFVKQVAKGTPVSYGHRWRAPYDGYVATVPIGYADGVPRALTNVGSVHIGGRKAPIVGTVTMDQLLVFLGDTPVEVGELVTLIGEPQNDEALQVEHWADAAGTITYEITSQLTARLPRRYSAD